MIARGYFDHQGGDGSRPLDRIRRTGYLRGARRWIVGENLAWGTEDWSTPRRIVRAWMASRGHRANILQARYREVGLAALAAAPLPGVQGATQVTEFGGVG